MPNRILLTSAVETYTYTNRLVRSTVSVSVSKDCEPEDVRKLLLGVAARHGLVLKSPAPTVALTDFTGSRLDFELNFWINNPPRAQQITSDLRFMIYRELANNEIDVE